MPPPQLHHSALGAEVCGTMDRMQGAAAVTLDTSIINKWIVALDWKWLFRLASSFGGN